MSEKIANIKGSLLSVPTLEGMYRRAGFPGNRRGLVVLAYHRVCNYDERTYPFDAGLISCVPEVFDRQMGFVSRNFHVTNFSRIGEMLNRGEELPPNSLVVTFDDGYADNHDIAFPILRKHGLTATVFVATGYVGTEEIFWYEKVSYYVKHSKRSAVRLDTLNFHQDAESRDQDHTIHSLLQILKTVPDSVRREALREMEATFTEGCLAEVAHLVRPLTWAQVDEMDRAGVEIGSHTVSHPVLTRLPQAEIRRELLESKETLGGFLGHEVVSVAYPVGDASAFNPAVERLSREVGYRFGLSYINGMNYGLEKPFALRRMHVETGLSFERFAAQTMFPRLFFKNGGK